MKQLVAMMDHGYQPVQLYQTVKGTASESMVSDSLQIEADQKPLTWKDGLQVTVILQTGMYIL